ncbi:RNA-binding protein 45 [Trebouxia sp. C0009 RCD-2024]
MEDLTRLFVVCGKAAEVDMLTPAFSPFGTVQSVKLVRDKGVAYVKFDKASSAARALEVMHEAVLNEGRGPLLKVFLAEAPSSSRRGAHSRLHAEEDSQADPDNMPARSRLFLVVPKGADAAAIEAHLASFRDLQYCKTDLIATKGVVFCKYAKSSSALAALEAITETGTLAGYKVKCMLAEPKGKRTYMDSSWSDPASPLSQQSTLMEHHPHLAHTNGVAMSPVTGSYRSAAPYSPTHSAQSVASLTSGFHDPRTPTHGGTPSHSGGTPQSGQGMQEYHMHNAFGALTSLANLQAIAAMQGAANLSGAGGAAALGANLDFVGSMSRQGALGGLGGLGINNNGTTGSSYGSNKQRLFVVIHKSATEDMVAHIFRSFPGMEYCDLKRDRITGQSKGFCYVYYSHADAAAAAMDHLNGMEFPPNTGHRLKVMYAEPMGSKTPTRSPQTTLRLDPHAAGDEGEEILHTPRHVPGLGLDDVHTPRGLLHSMPSDDSQVDALEHSVDVAAVQNSLAHMSMPHGAVKNSRRPQANSPGCDNEWEAESAAPDECLVYTMLTRPLPDYALHHTFSSYGPVVYVQLQRDPRLAIVKFSKAESARAALNGLNGTNICGEALAVSMVDPLLSSRITKRARVAE